MIMDLNQIQIYRRLELWCTALKKNGKSGGFGGVLVVFLCDCVWLCVIFVKSLVAMVMVVRSHDDR